MMRKESFKYAFDSIAKTYDDIRPGYPESVINTIVTVSKIPTDGRILEIGCGTGQATLAFARLGYYMECLDIGKTMCSITRQKCSRYPKIRVHNRMFETWNPRFSQYDIVLAAQSFHWIEPAVGFLKISRLLKNKGSIALLWNEHPRPYKGFFQKVRKIYDAVFPEEKKPKKTHSLQEYIKTIIQDINGSPLFNKMLIKRYSWKQRYNTSEYIKLLSTYSDIIVLDKVRKQALFAGISSLMDTEYGGSVEKAYETVLYMATKRKDDT